MLVVVVAPSLLLCLAGLAVSVQHGNGWGRIGASVTWAALWCYRDFIISIMGENNHGQTNG